MSKRWRINITPAERVARVVVGALGTVTGIVLLAGASSTWAVVLELLLLAAGLDLIVTGALGDLAILRLFRYREFRWNSRYLTVGLTGFEPATPLTSPSSIRARTLGTENRGNPSNGGEYPSGSLPTIPDCPQRTRGQSGHQTASIRTSDPSGTIAGLLAPPASIIAP